jgi:hypothetical protein
MMMKQTLMMIATQARVGSFLLEKEIRDLLTEGMKKWKVGIRDKKKKRKRRW